jgi:hypothetical protein
MNILKNGNLSTELLIFLNKKGEQLLNEIESKAKINETDMHASYVYARTKFAEKYEAGRVLPVVNRKPPKAAESEEKSTMEEKEPAAIENYQELLKLKKNDMKNIVGLSRCELKNGKILWLCKEHALLSNATVLEDYVESSASSSNSNENKNKLLVDIENIDLELVS